jgi:hypothetical protein
MAVQKMVETNNKVEKKDLEVERLGGVWGEGGFRKRKILSMTR